jgi:formylmethanofuran dehydrogenase subunit E
VKGKNTIRLIIYTFGVLTILLRPFVVYSVSVHADFAGKPERTYRLLQKLVKKKDEHHEADAETIVENRQSKYFLLIPQKLFERLFDFVSRLTRVSAESLLSPATRTYGSPTSNPIYCLISCFQI